MVPELGARLRLGLSLLTLLLAGAARPASLPAPGFGDDLQREIVHAWPDILGKGYYPIWVQLENTGSKEMALRIGHESGSGSGRLSTSKSLRLAAGEQRTVELFVPAFTPGGGGWGWSGAMLSIELGAGKLYLGGQLVRPSTEPSLLNVVVFSSKQVGEDVEGEWAKALSTSEVHPYPWGGGDPVPNVLLGSARVDRHMPSRYEGYTSLDLVVLDLDAEGLDPERLRVLTSWVRLGGRLLLLGADAEARARSTPGIGEWMEERFRLGLEAERTSAWEAGLGVLYVCDAPGPFLSDDEHRRAAEAALYPGGTERERDMWIPRGPRPAQAAGMIAIPGLGELPYGIFLLLLLAFAVVIGPVNFTAIRRMGRPALLLVSVPLISLVTSLLLLAYGIFHSGIDTRGTSSSLTLLDQRNGRADTVEACTTYAGLSPGEGLRPQSGTSVHPLNRRDEERRYEVDLTSGVLLSAGFLPVREAFEQLRLSDRASALGLDFSLGADGVVEVVNTLPVKLHSLQLADPNGIVHRLEHSLPPGDRARLVSTADPQGELALHAGLGLTGLENGGKLAQLAGYSSSSLRPSSYLAEIAAPLFLDDCGIDSNELVGFHSVMGVLTSSSEAW
jgi:hypothetical protein